MGGSSNPNYIGAAPSPSMPDDVMPATRKAKVEVANPNYDPFNRNPSTDPFIEKESDVPLSQADIMNWQTEKATLQARYSGEAQQQETLLSTLRGARKNSTATGNRNSTILTGPTMGMSASPTTLGSGGGKSLLGR